MKTINTVLKLISILFFIFLSSCAEKKEGLRIAVASNFAPTLKKIALEFTKESGIPITTIPGSTGKLFTQIQNGAPYDVFLAADQERPQLLLNKEMTKKPFTYALGQLVLWTPGKSKQTFKEILESDIKHIAIANPKLAPYGKAARETLVSLGLWSKINHKIVMGENVFQTFEFTRVGTAEAAFISLSQVFDDHDRSGIYNIPPEHYSPIRQDACIIKNSERSKQFMTFLQSRKAKEIILRDGYKVPSAK